VKHLAKRTPLSVSAAILVTLVLASQVLAHSWSGRIPLTSSGMGFGDGVVAVNNTTAVAVYVEWNGSWYNVDVRRSTTSGASWDAAQTLSTNGYDSAIAARDPFVDVVWSQNGRVRYARSVNGGVSFAPSMFLSAPGFAINLSVARGPGGLVIVAWQAGNTKLIKTRISTDGGVTFGATSTFVSHVQDLGTSVAAGSGVAYLAYQADLGELVVTSSTNGGANWSDVDSISSNAFAVIDQFSLTASGSSAYLAYADNNPSQPSWGTIRYQRTLNGGASWGHIRQISPPSWKTEDPRIELRGGVLRAVYGRRTSSGISIYYQQDASGTWSSPELVDPNSHGPAVTFAGKVIVQFEVGTGDSFVRTGT
jgi:hypothetical protein